MQEKDLKGEELKKRSASDEIKGLVKSLAGQKSEDEIKSMLLWMSKGEPPKTAIEEVWKWYYALCEVHTGPHIGNYSLQRKGNQDRLKEWIKKEFGDEPSQQKEEPSIPKYLLKSDTLRQIPDKALDYLINHDYDKNSFEKITAKEGNNMILLSWIEHVTEIDILNIRNESGRVVLSLRLRSGNILSVYYDEIAGLIDESKRANETRRNLADYNLNMSDEERRNTEEQFNESYAKTPEKEKEWSIAIEEANINIDKLQKLEHLFWQTVEKWKAGIWKNPSTKTFGELIAPFLSKTVLTNSVKQTISDEEYSKKNKSNTNNYIPKHQIVKDGVDKLLSSLRLEKPSATLEEAKRLYGHQTNDSYSNVNKLYHYKSKK